MLAETVATAPPPGLRDQVLADIGTVRPLPPVTPPITRQVAPPRRRFRRVALVAAAAAVIARGCRSRRGAALGRRLAGAAAQRGRPGAAGLGRRGVHADHRRRGRGRPWCAPRELNKAVVVTEDMPPPPEGKVYELWLDHEGVGMVPAGLMEADQDRAASSRATRPPPPAPGSPSSPRAGPTSRRSRP